MQSNAYQGVKVHENLSSSTTDDLVVEAPLQININTTPYTVVMRTPGNDIELITGLLYAEDICKNASVVTFETLEEQADFSSIIAVSIPEKHVDKGYLNKRTLLSVSSCGICGTTELQNLVKTGAPLDSSYGFSSDDIFNMIAAMQQEQKGFQQTGGSHAAALFTQHYIRLVVREDIGRHNAVDKCVGALAITQQLKEATFLVVSGRVSYEIVTKAFLAKIPVIIAVSACSSLAVDFAKEFGICLVGFSRKPKFTIYSNPLSLSVDE